MTAGGEFSLRVADVRRESAGVLSLTLEDPAGAELPTWHAGAHIDVIMGVDLERQYSLCGDAGDRRAWRIAVLREPDSRGGSAWIHDNVRVGDMLTVRGPRNNFPLIDAAEYLFIAGGIGITPLLPMITEVERRGLSWRLVFGGRSRESMAFDAELARHRDAVDLWPQDERGLMDLAGILPGHRPGLAVYACGPGALLDAVEERCGQWPSGTLNVERFRGRADVHDEADVEFEVVLDDTGITLTVPRGRSIVDVVTEAGVHVPTSCREGTCGTCETFVIEGEPDHRDSYLTPVEKEAGEVMMVCCSRSRSRRLVLDL